jgi:hypothetical protein
MSTLFDVAIGDLLIVETGRDTPAIHRVERVTPTRFETRGTVWHKKNGRRVGAKPDRWSWATIRLPKDGEIEAIRLHQAIGSKFNELESLVIDMRRDLRTVPNTTQTLATLIGAIEQLKALKP